MTPLESVSGSYAVHGFSGTAAPTASYAASFGERNIDGQGQISGGVVDTNTDGVQASGSPSPEALMVGATGDASIDGRLFGGVAPGGHLAIFGGGAAGENPEVRLYARQGTGFSNASLSGTWRAAWAGRSSAHQATWGDLLFDGSGGFTGTLNQATQDAGVTSGVAAQGSYSVDDSGRVQMTLTQPNAESFEAQITEGGTALIFSGTSNASSMFVGAAVASASGLSTSSVQGEYWCVGLAAVDGMPAQQRAYWGTATADGLGALILGLESNEDGATGSLAEGIPVSVASNGGVTANPNGPTGNLTGGVNQDASVMILGGDDTIGQVQTIFIFIKQ